MYQLEESQKELKLSSDYTLYLAPATLASVPWFPVSFTCELACLSSLKPDGVRTCITWRILSVKIADMMPCLLICYDRAVLSASLSDGLRVVVLIVGSTPLSSSLSVSSLLKGESHGLTCEMRSLFLRLSCLGLITEMVALCCCMLL